MVVPWVYFICQGGSSEHISIGTAIYFIMCSGLDLLLCYISSRYYTAALYDAKFIEDLLEDDEKED